MLQLVFLILSTRLLVDASNDSSTSNQVTSSTSPSPKLKKLPIDMTSIETILASNAIYVDKTNLALKLIQAGRFILIRPHKFGKTLFVNTLQDILEGKRELFENFYIGHQRENGHIWISHTVVKLTFEERCPILMFSNQIRFYMGIYGLNISRCPPDNTALDPSCFSLLIKYLGGAGKLVALLIDEYDRPFKNLNIKIREYFFTILNDIKALYVDGYLKFLFITGCSMINLLGTYDNTTGKLIPFEKRPQRFSRLIDLDDFYNSFNGGQYSTICGFSKDEIKHYFHDHIEAMSNTYNISTVEIYENIGTWYNGYRFTHSSSYVYNPMSILEFFNNKHSTFAPQSYWVNTQTPPFTTIKTLVEARIRYKKRDVLDLDKSYGIEELFQPTDHVHDASYRGEIDLNQHPLLESFLFQNGYLTVADCDRNTSTYFLQFPNMEIITTFMNAVKIAMKKDDEWISTSKKAIRNIKCLSFNEFNIIFRNLVGRNFMPMARLNTQAQETVCKTMFETLVTLTEDPEFNMSRNVHTTRASNGGPGKLDFLIETPKYSIMIVCKFQSGKDVLYGEDLKQTLDYMLPNSSLSSNKTLVRLLLNFDTVGIRDCIGPM